MDKHSESVAPALRQLKSAESEILDAGMRLMKSADGKLLTFDFFAIATLNRAAAISSAFHTLVNDFNMVAAGALVRIHLDTALRYFASHLVDDSEAFAGSVIRGNRIDKMADRDGKKLSDFHLSKELERKIPGTRNLYERACSYVHLSDVHTHHVLDGVIDPANGVVGLKIGARDRGLPDEHYINMCNTFTEISRIIVELIESWIDYKADLYMKWKCHTNSA